MRRFGLLILVMLLGPVSLPAQTATGSLSGTVSDATTGRPLAGARIILRGTLLTTEADSAGRFRFGRLEPGNYLLRAAAVGYTSDTLPPIVLGAGESRTIAIGLSPQPLELPSLVVTASRRVERIEEAQASIAVLSQDELFRRNVLSVQQALEFVPGVTFNGASSQDPQIDIRGATGIARGVGSRVLTLLDGHPALSADGGEALFKALPLLDVEQVEVVKGAYSALYGSNALGGVVNVLTTRVPDRPQTSARAYYGVYTPQSEYDFTSSTQSAQGLILQHSRWLGPAGARLVVGRETSDGFTQNGDYERWFARTKVTSRPEASHPWDVYLNYSRNDQAEFFTWESADRPYEVKPAELGDRSVGTNVLSGATITPLARSATLLRISPFLNWNENHNYFHDNEDWHRATKAGANVLLSVLPESGAHGLTFGVDGAYTTVRSSFLGSPGITDLAAVVQDEIRLGNRVRGTVGARLDYHSATGGSPETTVNPKVSLVVTPSDRVSLRGSLARGYRAPSAIEQFVSTIQYGIRVIPNPDLVGEQAWSAEIGATAVMSQRVRVDGALFQSAYDNLIGPAGAPGQVLVFQFQNVAEARVRGFDVGGRANLVRDFADLQLSYLFLDSEDLATGKELPYRSRHNLTGSLELFRHRLGVDYRYRSRVEEVLAYPADPRTSISILDVRGSVDALGVTFQAKVSNIFNTFYTDVQERSPGAPRSIGLTVSSTF